MIIAALKITVHEYLWFYLKKGICHTFEIIFQQIFLKLQSGSFKKTIFEIIQVPQNAAAVECCQRVAITEIHFLASLKLYLRKQADSLFQYIRFFITEVTAFSSLFDKLEQRDISQVILQVGRLVGCFGKYTGTGKPFCEKCLAM